MARRPQPEFLGDALIIETHDGQPLSARYHYGQTFIKPEEIVEAAAVVTNRVGLILQPFILTEATLAQSLAQTEEAIANIQTPWKRERDIEIARHQRWKDLLQQKVDEVLKTGQGKLRFFQHRIEDNPFPFTFHICGDEIVYNDGWLFAHKVDGLYKFPTYRRLHRIRRLRDAANTRHNQAA